MANETNLRQAKAKAISTGWVEQKDLQFYKIVGEEEKECNSEEEAAGIKGSLTIKISDINSIRYDVKCAKKTKSNTDNKAYAGIKTVKETYKSIAEFGLEEADKVHVSGDFNIYGNPNTGETIVRYKSNFFNRINEANITEENPFDPSSEFDIEMFVSAIVPEINKEGVETGRLKISGWIPVFNGVEPITLIATEDIADAINENYAPGSTAEFFGDIINAKVVKITEIPVAIGKPKTKTETSYKNELVITGATEAYEEGISAEKPYESDTIKAAIEERKTKLENRKNQQNNSSSSTKPSGSSRGRTIGF